MAESAGDASAAAAEVKDARIHSPAGYELLDGVDDDLRIGTGNQNRVIDDHRQTVKLPGTRYICYRFAAETAGREIIGALRDFIGGIKVQVAQKLCIKNDMDYIMANDLAELRSGSAAPTGLLCVIGAEIKTDVIAAVLNSKLRHKKGWFIKSPDDNIFP